MNRLKCRSLLEYITVAAIWSYSVPTPLCNTIINSIDSAKRNQSLESLEEKDAKKSEKNALNIKQFWPLPRKPKLSQWKTWQEKPTSWDNNASTEGRPEVQPCNGSIFNYIHLYWFAKKIFFPESFVVTSFLEKTAHSTDHRLLTGKKRKRLTNSAWKMSWFDPGHNLQCNTERTIHYNQWVTHQT